MVTMVVSEITPSAGCTVMGVALHLTILAQFSIMAVIVSGKILVIGALKQLPERCVVVVAAR